MRRANTRASLGDEWHFIRLPADVTAISHERGRRAMSTEGHAFSAGQISYAPRRAA